MHASPSTVASCPHWTANRVAVVLSVPLGHFLFLWLLTVLWVNMGQALNNFKEQLFQTKSIIVSILGLQNPVSRSDLTAEAVLYRHPQTFLSVIFVKHEEMRVCSCSHDDAKRVFHSQRHAKLSSARLHGAPSNRQTATPLPLLEQMVSVSYTMLRRFCFFSDDSLCLRPKLSQRRSRYTLKLSEYHSRIH